MSTIAVIVPCYQNEGSIPALGEELLALRQRLSGDADVRFVFVNDGSIDQTLELLLAFQRANPLGCKVVNLTRNFGSYNAFLAGMEHAQADCHVHLHADLQDPPALIDSMFDYWKDGERLVIAFRESRDDGSLFSTVYHWLVRRYAIRNIPPGGFDLVLFDEQIRQEMIRISEKNTNMVYLISWLGYPYKAIPYRRMKRAAGVSQWRFWSKVRLFFDTFFSFSTLPVLAVRVMAALCVVLSVVACITVLRNLGNEQISTDTWLLLLGTAILALMALISTILCEYVVRIHETARGRPNTVVDRVYGM